MSIKGRAAKRQQGTVLLLVLLLVIMFTGLGLMAMRHTQGEVRAAGSYFDVVQAESLALAPCAYLVSDIRQNFDYPETAAQNDGCTDFRNYKRQFALNPTGGAVSFSPVLDPPDCPYAGTGSLPDAQLSGADPSGNPTPLANTSTLSAGYSSINITYSPPETAPVMEGYSHSNDEGGTYGFYYFNFTSRASFGDQSSGGVDQGRAAAQCRLWVGPVSAL